MGSGLCWLCREIGPRTRARQAARPPRATRNVDTHPYDEYINASTVQEGTHITDITPAPAPAPVDPATAPGWDTDGSTVILAVIEHRHGTNNSAHRTLAGATAAVHDHVVTWWDDEVNGRWRDGETHRAIPTDPAEAIAAYFEVVEDEHYTILNDVPFGD